MPGFLYLTQWSPESALRGGLNDSFQRRELSHPPAFLVTGMRGARIASSAFEVMMEELDQRSPQSGRQAERDRGRGEPAPIGDPIVLEHQYVGRFEDLDLSTIAHPRTVPIDRHLDAPAGTGLENVQPLSLGRPCRGLTHPVPPPCVHTREGGELLPHTLRCRLDVNGTPYCEDAVFWPAVHGVPFPHSLRSPSVQCLL